MDMSFSPGSPFSLEHSLSLHLSQTGFATLILDLQFGIQKFVAVNSSASNQGLTTIVFNVVILKQNFIDGVLSKYKKNK